MEAAELSDGFEYLVDTANIPGELRGQAIAIGLGTAAHPNLEVGEAVHIKAVRIHFGHELGAAEAERIEQPIHRLTRAALTQVMHAWVEEIPVARIGVEQPADVGRALESDHFHPLLGEKCGGTETARARSD